MLLIGMFLCGCSPTSPDPGGEDPGSGNNDPGQTIPVVELEAVAVATPVALVTGEAAVLDASASVGPEGATLSFVWEQTAGAVQVTLVDADQAIAGFVAPIVEEDTPLSFTVTVSDGSDTDTASVDVIVFKGNRPPVAEAGDSQVTRPNSFIQLDGSASSDPDGDTLTYSWQQVVGDYAVQLDGADTATPSFRMPATPYAPTLQFELTVSDGELSATDIVEIFFIPAGGGGVAPADPAALLDVIPRDIKWLAALTSGDGLIDGIDEVIDEGGTARAWLQQLLAQVGIALPQLDFPAAVFGFEYPAALREGTLGADLETGTALALGVRSDAFLTWLDTALAVISAKANEGASGDVFGDQCTAATISVTAEREEVAPGLIRVTIVVRMVCTEGEIAGEEEVSEVGSFFAVETSGPVATIVALSQEEAEWVQTAERSIRDRLDESWVTAFGNEHLLVWFDNTVLPSFDMFLSASPVDGLDIPGLLAPSKGLTGLPPALTSVYDQAQLVAGGQSGKLSAGEDELPSITYMPLTDVCLVAAIRYPITAKLWLRFDDESGPASYFDDNLVSTTNSMLIGLPNEPIFAAGGIIATTDFADDVLGYFGWSYDWGMAEGGPIMALLAESGTLAATPNLASAMSISQLNPVGLVPQVGLATVVTVPNATELADDMVDEIKDECEGVIGDCWIEVLADGEVDTGTGNDVGTIWITRKKAESYLGILGDLVDYLDGDVSKVRIRFEVVDATHLAFTIGGGLARMEQVAHLVLTDQAPLAYRDLVADARSYLPADRMGEFYLALGQYEKFIYDVNMAAPASLAGTPTDPGDADEALGFVFGPQGHMLQFGLVLPLKLSDVPEELDFLGMLFMSAIPW